MEQRGQRRVSGRAKRGVNRLGVEREEEPMAAAGTQSALAVAEVLTEEEEEEEEVGTAFARLGEDPDARDLLPD